MSEIIIIIIIGVTRVEKVQEYSLVLIFAHPPPLHPMHTRDDAHPHAGTMHAPATIWLAELDKMQIRNTIPQKRRKTRLVTTKF
jgi:hypothetical protein